MPSYGTPGRLDHDAAGLPVDPADVPPCVDDQAFCHQQKVRSANLFFQHILHAASPVLCICQIPAVNNGQQTTDHGQTELTSSPPPGSPAGPSSRCADCPAAVPRPECVVQLAVQLVQFAGIPRGPWRSAGRPSSSARSSPSGPARRWRSRRPACPPPTAPAMAAPRAQVWLDRLTFIGRPITSA